MVDVNPFKLHPEEVVKVDNFREDFKNFVSVSDKNMIGMVADDESVIAKLHTKAKVNDPVNHPKHYNSYNDIEIIQLTEQLNFNRGSAIKYISRAGLKAVETEIQDLEKAEFHIRREIERLKINAKREN